MVFSYFHEKNKYKIRVSVNCRVSPKKLINIRVRKLKHRKLICIILGIYNFCVQAEFGFNIEADRLNKKELGGGACLDIGIYCIQLAQFVFNGEKPNKVCATFKFKKQVFFLK